MGSRVSCNDIDDPSSSTGNISSTYSTNDNVTINNSNINEQKLSPIPNSGESTPAHVYINDKFRLEFLDCNCCCDTTKKVANCDFQGINVLRDLYEMIVTPEYKLNCRCSCGDDNVDAKQSIKFGLTGSPNAHITCDGLDLSCPTSSDSGIKK